MKKINKEELRDLILDGIGTEELKNYNYSNITNMSYMFEGCSSLKSIPNLDTSNVTDMVFMFNGCTSLRDFNPMNFKLYDFNELKNEHLMNMYPELYL